MGELLARLLCRRVKGERPSVQPGASWGKIGSNPGRIARRGFALVGRSSDSTSSFWNVAGGVGGKGQAKGRFPADLLAGDPGLQ